MNHWQPKLRLLNCSVDIHPAVPLSRRAAEIIDKLQLNNPERFNPRAIYDGKELMFSTNPHLSDTVRSDLPSLNNALTPS